MDIGDALQLTHTEAPWWAGMGVVLLWAAAAVARRVSRRSTTPQGQRLGALETALELERTRRRQIEQLLRDEGVHLPYWPPDGPPPPAGPPDEDDPVDDVADLSTAAIPAGRAFTDQERARLLRYRR